MRLLVTKAVLSVILIATSRLSAAPTPDFEHAPLISRGDMLNMPKPDWPYEARRRGHGGAVVLGFVIGADGTPENIRVLANTASPETTKAAVTWLQSCKANPARHGKVLRTFLQFVK